jgi:hypothetical protein
MAITFTLPADIEQRLREEFGDLNAAAKEATLVELYRQDRLTHHQLATALGLDRFETEAVLKRHNVTEDLITPDEYNEQMSQLRALLGE